MAMSTTHRSKVDFWLFLAVLSAGVFMAGTATYPFFAKGFGHPAIWILLGSLIFYLAIIFIFAYPVFYEIAPPDLIIRSGGTRSRIPLSSIESVQETRNPLSAPAWSLDRLRIDYRQTGRVTFALISPQNKDAFLRELVHKAEGLQRSREGIIRSSASGGV